MIFLLCFDAIHGLMEIDTIHTIFECFWVYLPHYQFIGWMNTTLDTTGVNEIPSILIIHLLEPMLLFFLKKNRIESQSEKMKSCWNVISIHNNRNCIVDTSEKIHLIISCLYRWPLERIQFWIKFANWKQLVARVFICPKLAKLNWMFLISSRLMGRGIR